MTIEEKAQELMMNTGNYTNMFDSRGAVDHDLWLYRTKQACILFCESVISDYKSYRVKPYLTLNQSLELAEYWEDIKKEIEQL